ncbi:MAG: exodeoxyribonuclease III [Cyanobacteria bacterium P01_C01_bin.89]
MKITTWNVNSIRTRLEHVTDWLGENPVDVLCVQETKVQDKQFPEAAFRDRHLQVEFFGQKSYNGVALISQEPLTAVARGFSAVLGDSVSEWDEQKRVISGMLGDVRVVNLYVPNGSAIASEKYEYKLGWLAVLKDYLARLLEESPKLCVCGDFNIALENKDIYKPEKGGNHIMASEAEREALQEVLGLGLRDSFRKFTDEGGHYSWWDYRAAGFQRNRGWRIDHLYLSDALYDDAADCTIDATPRGWEKPSDHTPVTVTF